jgi:hypothetical protein
MFNVRYKNQNLPTTFKDNKATLVFKENTWTFTISENMMNCVVSVNRKVIYTSSWMLKELHKDIIDEVLEYLA